MERLNSGIEGLDKVIYGGFPSDRAYVISGEPGTGKTIFSLQYLLAGLHKGQRAIYVSIDEKPAHVILDALSLGWDLQSFLDNGQLKIIDVTRYFSSAKTNDQDAVSLNRAIEDILGFVKESGAERLAIDPIAPIIFNPRHDAQTMVSYIRSLVFELEECRGCTTLMTSYVPVGSQRLSLHGVEEYVASGIIVLKLKQNDQGKNIRTVAVRKMRGTRIELSEYNCEILPERGFVLRQPV
ncbi:MAG: ATPase domain-containing protein [bacterium]